MADTSPGGALGRRAISIPAVVVGFVLIVPALVVLVPLAAVADLVRGKPFPTVRMLLFGTWYLGWEVIAVVASGLLWVATGAGRWVDRPWSARLHTRLQARWVASVLAAAERVLRLRLEVDGAEVLAGDGPLVVLCRHASMVDTLVPARSLFAVGRSVRYVLKTELAWDPALDLVGHRLPNHFVDRSGANTAAELDALEALAAGAGPSDAVVIFPEGTRWSPAKRTAALERLAAAAPDRHAVFVERGHTLPPRPAGTLAVLRGARTADVVVLAHTGLEGLAGPGDALRLVPFRHPVRVALWRIPRSEVPTDDDAAAAWLDDQWHRVDQWVAAHRATD